MTTATYQVTGMSCAHCESAVREEVSQIDGVIGVDVSSTSGILTVDATDSVDDGQVIAAVDEAGYSAARS